MAFVVTIPASPSLAILNLQLGSLENSRHKEETRCVHELQNDRTNQFYISRELKVLSPIELKEVIHPTSYIKIIHLPG
jgi:hypothetical protein